MPHDTESKEENQHGHYSVFLQVSQSYKTFVILSLQNPILCFLFP